VTLEPLAVTQTFAVSPFGQGVLVWCRKRIVPNKGGTGTWKSTMMVLPFLVAFIG